MPVARSRSQAAELLDAAETLLAIPRSALLVTTTGKRLALRVCTADLDDSDMERMAENKLAMKLVALTFCAKIAMSPKPLSEQEHYETRRRVARFGKFCERHSENEKKLRRVQSMFSMVRHFNSCQHCVIKCPIKWSNTTQNRRNELCSRHQQEWDEHWLEFKQRKIRRKRVARTARQRLR